MPYNVKRIWEIDGYNYDVGLWVGCKELSDCMKNSDDGCSGLACRPVGKLVWEG